MGFYPRHTRSFICSPVLISEPELILTVRTVTEPGRQRSQSGTAHILQERQSPELLSALTDGATLTPGAAEEQAEDGRTEVYPGMYSPERYPGGIYTRYTTLSGTTLRYTTLSGTTPCTAPRGVTAAPRGVTAAPRGVKEALPH